MSTSIGLCGAHRTGKTTLARRYAEINNIPFVQISTSDVFERHGLDPAKPMSFSMRLWIQGLILAEAKAVWEGTQHFITDRTPIDFMAYTLADIQGDTEVDAPALKEYMAQCFDALSKYFSHLVVIQPGIPLVFEQGKAALNSAYIEHLNTLTLGLCHDSRNLAGVSVMRRGMTDIQSREMWLSNVVAFGVRNGDGRQPSLIDRLVAAEEKLRHLQSIVTTEHESKGEFIARVRGVLKN
jgi:hypothetical protein